MKTKLECCVNVTQSKIQSKRKLTGIILNKKVSQHEDKLMFNVYAFSNEAVKYIKQRIVRLKRKLEKHTVVVRNFNIVLSMNNLQ